jgi:hypothetical protein
MKNNTYYRRRSTLSKKKKSHATMLAACACRELAPALPRRPRGRVESGAGEHSTDRRGRYPDAESGQLTADPPVAPARILACQPQHHGPHIGRHARASAPAGRLAPLAAHERPMPAQQRARSDHLAATRSVEV